MPKFEDAVYVLHAFQKETRKTPHADIELAARRYKLTRYLVEIGGLNSASLSLSNEGNRADAVRGEWIEFVMVRR